MRRFFLLPVLAAAVFVSGCAANCLPLESTAWQFETMQGEGGAVVACSQDLASSFPEAEVLAVSCRFENGALWVEVGSESWNGTYRLIDSKGSEIFEVQFSDGETGYLTNGLTTFADGSQQGTMNLTKGGLTLNFVPAE